MLTYDGDPSIWELEINGSTIRAEGLELSEDSISLLSGETAKLTSIFTPVNTTERKLSWESSDDSVATVSNSGVITAVGEGTATITATAIQSGYSDTCVVTVTPATASVDGKFFATLDEALEATQNGDTVKLQIHVTMQQVSLKNNVCLDLNGNALTIDYLVSFKGSSVINGADNGEGKVIIDKDNLVLSENNPQLPIYDEENGCYLFSRVKNDRFEATTNADGKVQYSTSPMFKEYVHTLMDTADKVEQSGVEVIIRLTWSDSDGQYEGTQDYTYYDESIAEVIASYTNEDGNVNYDKLFFGIFVGNEIESGVNVSVSTVVRSAAGVEMESEKTALFTA